MPPRQRINAIVCNPVDTLDNWASADPLLERGQFAIVFDGNKRRIKVGDGANRFNVLPYIDEFVADVSIAAAVPTTNPGSPIGFRIWETSTPGTYSNFLDYANTPIVVSSGQYARIIDNGSFYTKVLIPYNFAGYATEDEIKAIYAADFTAAPVRPSVATLLNKSSLGFYPDPVPVDDDYYIDMRQSFDLNKAHSIGVRSDVDGELNCAVVTIDSSNHLTIIAEVVNFTVIGQFTTTDVSTLIEAYAAAGHDMNVRAYVAVKNTVDSPLRIDSTATGIQVWQFNGVTRNLSAKLLNTDIQYEVFVYNDLGLQGQLKRDFAKNLATVTTSPYKATEINSTILVNTSGLSATATVQLPRYGIDKGKIFTVKRIAGATYAVSIVPQDGSLIDGAASFTLSALYDSQRVQFDGQNYWRI